MHATMTRIGCADAFGHASSPGMLAVSAETALRKHMADWGSG